VKLYLKKRKDCPVCRKPIDFDSAQRILNEKPSESQTETEPSKKPAPRVRRVEEFNVMPYNTWAEIQQVDTIGSFGSKIHSLVRHLVWLQEQEPGAKSIVFSAWADVSLELSLEKYSD
jgi:E3 ubiquitin-protein ligase SHPRH